MNKISCSILLIIVFSAQVYSQENAAPEHTKSVALKFAPAGLAAGKITFGGEYNFRHRNSFTFIAGVPCEKTNTITYDGMKSDVTAKAFSLMAGYRHYLGRKTMSGFYIEPYLKYLKQDANGLIKKELQGQTAIFDTHAHYEGVGIGAQLGVQVMIAKRVAFDFFVLGPEANSSKVSTVSTDITDNLGWSFADEQQVKTDIKNNLKDIPVIGRKILVKVDTEKKTVLTNYSGFIPGLRVGASIGIRF